MFEEIYARIKAAKRIYIWGAGSMAQVVLARLREQDIAVEGFFVDQDTPFAERHALDLPCYSLAEVLSRETELSVVVGHGHNELAPALKEHSKIKDIFIIPNPYLQYTPAPDTIAAALNGGIAGVRQYLADEESYENLALYYRLHTPGDYEALREKMQIAPLFSAERISLTADEAYFDVGAFNGDTVAEFIARAGAYRSIVAFEPDTSAAAAFREHFAGADDIYLEEMGVSEKSGTAALTGAGTQSAGLAVGKGIELTSIDDYVARTGRVPTLLKVAVPNYALAVLLGAKETLARHKIKVAVVVAVAYSDGANVLDIIRYLGELPAGYRLRLRYRLRVPTQLWLYAD